MGEQRGEFGFGRFGLADYFVIDDLEFGTIGCLFPGIPFEKADCGIAEFRSSRSDCEGGLPKIFVVLMKLNAPETVFGLPDVDVRSGIVLVIAHKEIDAGFDKITARTGGRYLFARDMDDLWELRGQGRDFDAGWIAVRQVNLDGDGLIHWIHLF